MIHDRAYPKVEVSPLNGAVNPFYLLFSNEELERMPLPRAVKHGMKEAMEWRDQWELHANDETKAYCLYHPRLRNWVGGAEDGQQVVYECQQYWKENQ